jgi:hypothetical protein
MEYKNNNYIYYDSYNESISDIPTSDKISKCAKFGAKHLVTGQIEYDFAIHCRENKDKCGKEGILFSSTSIDNKMV